MNLAVRDVRHNAGRFAFTTLGVGLLLMIVMGMGGIYRGLIYEATLLVDRVGADLWVVQGSTRGPFAEISRIPANLEDRVLAVPGVARACRFSMCVRRASGRTATFPARGSTFLPDLRKKVAELDREKPTAVYCDSGYRASIGTSILKQENFKCVCNIPGSWQAWKKAKFPIEGENGQ